MAEQQQQQQQDTQAQKDEYLAAQRAAVEAVYVGRETLQQSVQQGEQLGRAEQMAEETEFKLDKAGRMLRGMTWSGWVANMFTKSVGPPPEQLAPNNKEVPATYDGVPSECQAAAQSIQNYHANVQVLEQCETEEQKDTLKAICESMFQTAQRDLEALKEEHYQPMEAYILQFERDLSVLRTRQKESQEMTRQLGAPPTATTAAANGGGADTTPHDKDRAELFGAAAASPSGDSGASSPPNKASAAAASSPPMIHPHQQEQDEHLAIMAQSLGELGTIAHNLHSSMAQQNQTIHSLDNRTDNITEKSKMVTRRADRIVQKRSWTPVKPTFDRQVAIRHVASGRYLAALDAKELCLVPQFHPETCVFGLWTRQGNIFGLQNRYSRRWAGQSVFGGLACSAYSFGRREEWEKGDDEWSSTRLLCASAGWGAGGYLTVRPTDFAILIGGCSVEERNKADLWAIVEQQ